MNLWLPIIALGNTAPKGWVHAGFKQDQVSFWHELSLGSFTTHTHFTYAHNQPEKSDPLGHQTPKAVERVEAISIP